MRATAPPEPPGDRPVLVRPRTSVDRFRVGWRIGASVLWTVVCYLGLLPWLLVAWVSPRLRVRLNAGAQRIWSRGLLRVFGVKRERAGLPPRKPFLLVSNHLTYLDILVLGAELGAVFISKLELGTWPGLGHLARVTGTIFVDRSRPRDALRVLDEMDRAIEAGAGVVLFPEGTSSRGDRVYPLKAALLEWAAQRQYPVHAATVRYSTGDPARPARDAVCWWGDDTPFFGHFLGMASLPRIHAGVTFGEEAIVADHRSALAGRLHQALDRLFVPLSI